MKMSILDRTGDTVKEWDADNATEVSDARALFDKLLKDGHTAVKTDAKGQNGEAITSFDQYTDPNEQVTMIPRMVGG